ncbi:MAG: hypothetical protein WCG80_16660 [Spirochaetales bacterium]
MKSQRFVDIPSSSHAIDRGLQRGISQSDIRKVLEFGHRSPSFGGRQRCRIPPNPFVAAFRPELKALEDVVVVLGLQDAIITVEWVDHRFVEFAQ